MIDDGFSRQRTVLGDDLILLAVDAEHGALPPRWRIR